MKVPKSKSLSRILRTESAAILQLAASKLLVNFCLALTYFYLSQIIFFDLTLGRSDSRRTLGVALFLSFAAYLGLRYLRLLQYTWLAQNFRQALRRKLFHRLFHLGPAYIQAQSTGSLIQTVGERLNWLGSYVHGYFASMLYIVLLALGAGIYFAYRLPLAGLALILGSLLIIVMPLLFERLARAKQAEHWESEDEFYTACLDGIEGVKTLKALQANSRYLEMIREKSEANRRSMMRGIWLSNFTSKLGILLLGLTQAIVVYAVGQAAERIS
ncbi:MAG: ABC transporter transmembrane domain-containing protein [Eubacteriales bacterium]|nr:ABC transporter transmembrane domain-containing protein [Eubacteriales bacterium]